MCNPHLQHKLQLPVCQPRAGEGNGEPLVLVRHHAHGGHVEGGPAHGGAGGVDHVDAVVDGGGRGPGRAPVKHQGVNGVGDNLENRIDLTL